MKKPVLTILLFVDNEKDPKITKYFFDSLMQFNADGLKDILVIGLTQRKTDPMLEQCLSRFKGKGILHCCNHPFVDGYPVWDVMESSRDVWPLIDSDYVMWSHPEFFIFPERLARTVEFLRTERPTIALGNLRRPGDDLSQWTTHHYAKDVSDSLTLCLDDEDWRMARIVAPMMHTMHWLYWHPKPKPGVCPWLEDVFFVKKGFLDACGFMRDVGRLPFQDVYDLMGVGLQMLAQHKVAPKCYRMRRHDHEAIHIWHPKPWSQYTPAMRDWFLSQPDEFADTKFLDKALWEKLIACRGPDRPLDEKPVIALRRGPGGTVTRFAVGMAEYLGNGGADVVREFYKSEKDKGGL